MVTVADCERVQSSWFRARAATLGGEVWTDDEVLWTDGPDGMNLMFPRALTAAGVRRGVDRARDLGRDIVGVWLSLEVDPAPLAEAGFERGWSPWWMTADLADVPVTRDPRVGLEQDSSDYEGEFASYREQLALTRQRPARAWYAAAHTPGHFAGRAWSYRDGDLAGVFDMEVWPEFQRTGLGTALLATVCAAAREAGAEHAVLNATPDGERLYRTCGFRRIGEGITWWHHLGNG
ncbi:GCN5 family acetyltransferase [Luteipulveratus mongoliensis]|uniref:GCN5 family acetyltransferase n=2 Tax=Luteipulveratus mongoliensis TaxID=571913 RepID=A0A0K1JPX9_9MICO|nr:GCN5 family acetyltransferase [Luteipulveratus mongoliensis]